MLILFKFQEDKIKILFKKYDRYNKKYDNNKVDIDYIHNIDKRDEIDEKEEQYKKDERNEEYVDNKNNDIDSFIDPIENNN
jgi:hypothetical protein